MAMFMFKGIDLSSDTEAGPKEPIKQFMCKFELDAERFSVK